MMRSRKLTKKMKDTIYGTLCARIDRTAKDETTTAIYQMAGRHLRGDVSPGDGVAATALITDHVRHETIYATMRLELRRVLDSCSTTGQLVSVWPEVKPLVKSLCPAPRKAAPVAPSAELTAYLGLGGDRG